MGDCTYGDKCVFLHDTRLGCCPIAPTSTYNPSAHRPLESAYGGGRTGLSMADDDIEGERVGNIKDHQATTMISRNVVDISTSFTQHKITLTHHTPQPSSQLDNRIPRETSTTNVTDTIQGVSTYHTVTTNHTIHPPQTIDFSPISPQTYSIHPIKQQSVPVADIMYWPPMEKSSLLLSNDKKCTYSITVRTIHC